MTTRTDDDIEVSVTISASDLSAWLNAAPWRGDLILKLEAWCGEFGRIEVAHAFAAAMVAHELRHRGLYPRPSTGHERDD